MTEANEQARIRLGEIYTAMTILIANVGNHQRQNDPINPDRVQTFADACDKMAGELRELADSMIEDDQQPLPLHGIPAAIGVTEPLTHRPGEYMGIPRRCPCCGSVEPETRRRVRLADDGPVHLCEDAWHTRPAEGITS